MTRLALVAMLGAMVWLMGFFALDYALMLLSGHVRPPGLLTGIGFLAIPVVIVPACGCLMWALLTEK